MRLYVAVSHHGYGHLAQTAAVLSAAHALRPGLSLIVHSALPTAVLRARLPLAFEHWHEPCDCVPLMHDSTRLDLDGTLAAYRDFHHGWPARVDALARRLARLAPDGVFCNVAYWPLAAAAHAGLPAVALCSLNWADIFDACLGGRPGTAAIHAEMLAAYRAAARFLKPRPAMPMPALDNGEDLPPLAIHGRERRAELRRRLDLPAATRLILVGLGGIPHRLDVEHWPSHPGLTWLLPDAWDVHRPDARSYGAADMPYADLLASSDALLTKPGYGSFVEAATLGLPVLYLPRPEWPEAAWLVEWLHGHGRAEAIAEDALARGALAEPLERLWAMPAPPRPVADPAGAARRVLELL
ncbi:MAG: hypothetical protein HY778_03100 [Betaproteobacteria bacterium]|nr:hypothetical protein [Betaproteobacteria bacterium]